MSGVAVVTGAGSGIGLAVARRLAADGWGLGLVDLSREGLEVTGRGLDVPCALLDADVGDRAAMLTAVDEVAARLGCPTALVNAAGLLRRARALDHTRELWQRTLATNLDGPFWLSQAVTRRLLEAGRPGTIVNVASVEAFHPLKGHVAYSASKGALVMLTRAMALELAPHGIRVNAVCPGVIETPMNADARADPGRSRDLLDLVPMGRFGSPAEVAELVAFLVSDRASYLTGAIVPIDGGWSVR